MAFLGPARSRRRGEERIDLTCGLRASLPPLALSFAFFASSPHPSLACPNQLYARASQTAASSPAASRPRKSTAPAEQIKTCAGEGRASFGCLFPHAAIQARRHLHGRLLHIVPNGDAIVHFAAVENSPSLPFSLRRHHPAFPPAEVGPPEPGPQSAKITPYRVLVCILVSAAIWHRRLVLPFLLCSSYLLIHWMGQAEDPSARCLCFLPLRIIQLLGSHSCTAGATLYRSAAGHSAGDKAVVQQVALVGPVATDTTQRTERAARWNLPSLPPRLARGKWSRGRGNYPPPSGQKF